MATLDGVSWDPASLAASRALDAEIEASLVGGCMHPNGTVFVPEHLAEVELVDEYRRNGLPVAIVEDDGRMQLLPPHDRTLDRTTQAVAIGIGIALLLLWLSRREGSAANVFTRAG